MACVSSPEAWRGIDDSTSKQSLVGPRDERGGWVTPDTAVRMLLDVVLQGGAATVLEDGDLRSPNRRLPVRL
jgi:hypothetical protein